MTSTLSKVRENYSAAEIAQQHAKARGKRPPHAIVTEFASEWLTSGAPISVRNAMHIAKPARGRGRCMDCRGRRHKRSREAMIQPPQVLKAHHNASEMAIPRT